MIFDFFQAVKSTTRHAQLKTIFGMVAALFLELDERIRAATIPNIVYRTSKKMACPCASKPNINIRSDLAKVR